ncbi:PKD domain-containing protein [Candidatus Saccharibacteria bacterium]|nr:MAG: PKD domain-containing protein [Candidatus Saccharibacteria bacterium]
MLRKLLKLTHHKHTAKVRPHEHTSYVPLALLLFVVGVCLTTYTATAWERPGPAAGSIGMYGTVPGKPPTTAAVIKTPTSGQRFSQTPVVVSGTCPKDTLVELFKNDIFAGSAVCSSDGTFSFEIDLLIGQNTLVAKVFDALNQVGPDSGSVVVYFDAPTGTGSPFAQLNFGGPQLLLNTDAVFRGTFPGKEMTIPLDIIGGRAPYAINIQWGDSTNKVVSRPDNTSFRTAHTYQKAGTYQLSVQATDADGRVAFITVASIVNGQPDPDAAVAATTKETTNVLLVLWPLFAATFAVVVSFWIGEWREKRLLEKRGLLLAA